MNKVQRVAILIYLWIISIVLAGCLNNKGLSHTESFFDNFKSYEATVKVRLLENSKPNVLKMKQKASLKGNYEYILEEPTHLKGLHVVYDGKTITQYHLLAPQGVMCEPSKARQEMLLTSFVERYHTSNEIIKGATKLEDKSVITIEMPIEGNYKYMAREKLYLDEEKLLPIQMNIYDEAGNITLQVDYESFKYND